MKELTIEMDVLLKKDLKDYLMSLNGVLDAKLLFVNELYDTEGITKFQSDFDICKKYRNVKIEIEYDTNVISETDIINIVNDY